MHTHSVSVLVCDNYLDCDQLGEDRCQVQPNAKVHQEARHQDGTLRSEGKQSLIIRSYVLFLVS